MKFTPFLINSYCVYNSTSSPRSIVSMFLKTLFSILCTMQKLNTKPTDIIEIYWKRAGKIVKVTTGNEMHTIQHFSLEVLLPCVWRLFLLFSEYNPPPTWLRIYLGAKRAVSLNASVNTTLNCRTDNGAKRKCKILVTLWGIVWLWS